MNMTIDACDVRVANGEMSPEEAALYVARGREKYADALHGLDIRMDGEYADITYHVNNAPFQRIRRITGYLVGTLDRFNNAKRAEEHDRVKHTA